MLSGVSVAYGKLPVAFIEAHNLERRVQDRGGEKDVQFLLGDAERVLPVWHGGRLRLLPWGCRRGEGGGLPCTAWTRLATVEAGKWKHARPEEVLIPTTLCLDRVVWYRVREGVRGLLARDRDGAERVYVLVEPSTHYYRVMTRSDWMPALVGEQI
jgi:hypothetical protein